MSEFAGYYCAILRMMRDNKSDLTPKVHPNEREAIDWILGLADELQAENAAAREEIAKLREAWPEWNLETEDLEAAPRTIIPHDGFWYVNKDMIFAKVFVSCDHCYSMYNTRDEAINAAAGITPAADAAKGDE